MSAASGATSRDQPRAAVGGGDEILDDAFRRMDEAWTLVDGCRRALDDGIAPISIAYLDGASGNLVRARDALRKATEPDEGCRWRARLLASGTSQLGEPNARLSVTEEDEDDGILPALPDVGAMLLRSEAMTELARSTAFSTLLASALAEHRWLHVSSGVEWSCAWPAADALVRALNEGRPFPRVGHRQLRGTVDRRVAVELAALGWRRMTFPSFEDVAHPEEVAA